MKRLKSLENTENTSYVDERLVAQDLRHAHFVFEKGGFTIINVSNKPVETSANEIHNIMATRFEYRGRRLKSPYIDENGDSKEITPQ
jgi:regulator of PEP synthase PpsR (kinase-PPPase family)